VVAVVQVGTSPDAVTYNPLNHEILVADAGSNSVSWLMILKLP